MTPLKDKPDAEEIARTVYAEHGGRVELVRAGMQAAYEDAARCCEEVATTQTYADADTIRARAKEVLGHE